MMKRRLKHSNGFTLLELLLAMGIIATALAVMIPIARRAHTESKFSLVRQHGSEIAGYIMTWTEKQARAQREKTNFTLRDFLCDDIRAGDAGFESKQLVHKYTGSDDYNGVESLVPPDKMPRNPFNEASYFNAVNEDTEVPSKKAGLLYLTAQPDPQDRDYLNFYLLFTSTAPDDQGNRWHGGMDHQDPDKIRKGVFVARLYDDEEYGGREENLLRWKRSMQ